LNIKHKPDIILTNCQKEDLEKLWLIYGNCGQEHSVSNHKFIQKILEKGQDQRGSLNPTEKCLLAVEIILTDLQVGDMVIIPDRFSLRNNRQSRTNIILGIYPRQEYLIMTKILKSGKPSQDFSAKIYWHLNNAHHLERMVK